MGNTARLQQLTQQLRLAEIDILCCQGMERTFDGSRDPAREIAESLRMAYSFSATDCRVDTSLSGKETIMSGLWILAGAHTWMLNGGSFILSGKDPLRNQVVQFAVIRKHCNSVLVINTDFSPFAAIQRQQMQALFSHALLKDQYDAVVLCGNRKIAVSKRDIQAATALSSYKLANAAKTETSPGEDSAVTVPRNKPISAGPSIDKVIFTLIARNSARATVKMQGASTVSLLDSVLISEFEFKQVDVEAKHKFFPRSFLWRDVHKPTSIEIG
jgi:endonuclease/exonuclease/phosphatase family metal-dependent hydrolase